MRNLPDKSIWIHGPAAGASDYISNKCSLMGFRSHTQFVNAGAECVFQHANNVGRRVRSMDPSVYGARNSALSGASLAREKPPPSYEDVVKEEEEYQQSVRAPSVWLKIAQFVLAVLCLVLISDGYRLEVSQNVTAMHFPFIVFSAYTLITGVIIFSYVMGMKMRELLIRIFGTMGALLFLISGIHTANRTVVFWEHWQFTYEEGDTEENPDFAVATIPRRRVCFVAQVALSFLASAVYLGDVVYSCGRTMEMLN